MRIQESEFRSENKNKLILNSGFCILGSDSPPYTETESFLLYPPRNFLL